MSEIWLTGLMTSWRGLAIPLSLLIEVAIAVVGILPSFFITAANVAVFGVWWGTALSIAGESLGAVVAFLLYRRGLEGLAGGKSKIAAGLQKRMSRLSQAPPARAFLLVVAFRLLPYVPSGAVTVGAAGGRMRALSFTLASTLGKIPALAVEVAMVSMAMKLPLKGFLALVGGIILAWVLFEVLKGRRARNKAVIARQPDTPDKAGTSPTQGTLDKEDGTGNQSSSSG